jgi:hypothetical protein
MKEGKAIVEHVKKRGYVFNPADDTYYPPAQAAALNIISKPKRTPRTNHVKTGWIDDTRNIAAKDSKSDMFIKLVKIELGLDVWPEFFFDTTRQYRFDYAIPVCTESAGSTLEEVYTNAQRPLKIAIECEGGIWAKGNSGHSSGTGIMRDMEKGTLANVSGWTLIRRTPDQLITAETLDLIRKAVTQISCKNIHSF